MSYLALSDELVRQYWEYRYSSSFDKEKIRKLFKYIYPFLVAEEQLPIHPSDRVIIGKQIESDPLMKIAGRISEEDLVKKTKLKFMLTDKNEEKPFVTFNIVTNELKVNFSTTYKSKQPREKARKHVKALLTDGEYIKIIDKYMARDRCWSKCKEILEEVLPKKQIRMTILTTNSDREKNLSNKKKEELKKLHDHWEIRAPQFNESKYHDRYIETDKVRIILSSGLENLSDEGKDLTYVVEVKENR